jgi:Protein of unknwon function (DUF3310)
MALFDSPNYHRPMGIGMPPQYTSTTGDTPKALETQVGGAHYKDMKIQPLEFIHANNIGFCEANAIKYLCRWRTKNGIQDLEKAAHYIALLIQFETEKTNGNESTKL